ncbi:hypothetical protein GJAV_G00200660 [Gymnothorax javanicus]|nr:hypothetical protein GJAV_G00200660 [Gymnothorax javanicus]
MHLLSEVWMLMEPKPTGSLTSVSGDDSSSDTGKCLPISRKCKRREKNRVAAQRSRKRQTERADALHEELQSLEHSNAAYEKEIAGLRLEIEYYSSALKQHEPHCNILKFSGPETTLNAPSNALVPIPTHTSAALPHTDFSFPDLLNSTDWPALWDCLVD